MTLDLKPKPLVFHIFIYHTITQTPLQPKRPQKVVLCVVDMKGETIQTYELILHILNYE